MKNDPSRQDDLREMGRLLSRLPDKPVASNFTARVMQTVELAALEEARSHRRGISSWRIFSWHGRAFLPRLAVAASVLILGGLSLQHYHAVSYRDSLVQTVAQVTSTQTAPSVEALKNFDAIQRMGHPAQPDDNLLALLQ
jgi:hypothetical protein